MTITEILDKAANDVLKATRLRYTERVADTTVVDAKANSKGITATCKGTADYVVAISADFNPYSTKENPVGTGSISCTCRSFKRMNPEGHCPFQT
jgi:spore coat protein U-like protein